MARLKSLPEAERAVASLFPGKMPVKAPDQPVGILSQTLHPSPTVRWILPAKIRNKDRNDVAFVGQNYIQLREFLESGQLTDVTTKIDLGVQILSIKVISAENEYITVWDQILGQEQDEMRYLTGGQPIAHDEPAQLLVACVASSELVFMYAKEFGPGDVRFVIARKRLLEGVSLPERYGRNMAIESESRAMAIASSVGHCAIFSLKKVDKIKREIDGWNQNKAGSFKPTQEDRFIQIDGLILKMDFLPGISDESHKITLLLLVANSGRTAMVLYRWDARRPMSQIRPLPCSGQVLPIEDSFPLVLIPLPREASFTIVTETALVVYENIYSSKAKRSSIPLPKVNPETFEASTRPPLWVQWAKPYRAPHHQAKSDDFYLIREDGQLRYYVVNNNSHFKVDSHFSPGCLGVNVDTAFAMLPGPRSEGGDIFLVGGDMTDGGVYHCAARGIPVLTQIIPNVAPIQDMLVLGPRDHPDSRTSRQASPAERIFISSGRGTGHSYVSEMRFGVEAQVGWTIDYAESASSVGMWALEDSGTNRLLLFVSHPFYTSLIAFHMPDLEVEILNGESCPGIDLEQPTLAIASTSSGSIIQITQSAVNIVSTKANGPTVSYSQHSRNSLLAVIEAKLSLLVTAHATSDHFELGVSSLVAAEDQPLSISPAEDALHLEEEPIALAITCLANAAILIVATIDGQIHILVVDAKKGLKLVSTQKVSDMISDAVDSPVSSLVALASENTGEALLLCGFRNGRLGFFHLSIKTGPFKMFHLSCLEVLTLGTTTVTVVDESSSDSENAALAMCGSELRRCALLRNRSGLDYQVSSIWLTDHNNLSFPQPSVNALCRIKNLRNAENGGLEGLMVCATEKELLVSSLVVQDQSIPRRMRVDGNSKSLVFCRFLNRIIVAVDQVKLVQDETTSKSQRSRVISPALCLLDPNDVSHQRNLPSTENPVEVGVNGDRVRCLLNWTPSDGSRHFDMILIGLDSEAPESGIPSSKVMCISSKYFASGSEIMSKAKVVARYSGRQIHCFASIGRCSLLTAAGNDLILQSLDVGTRRWSTLSHFALPSSAVALSTQGSFIFAATTYHSMLVLKEQDRSLTMIAADSKARNAQNVVSSTGGVTVVGSTSGHGTSVLGFSSKFMHRRTELLFEATLPLAIDQLRSSNLKQRNSKARQYFTGSTADGTMYRFMTLQQHEWLLLQFIQSLCDSNQRASKQLRHLSLGGEGEKTSRKSLDALWSTRFQPTKMHINGDRLAAVLQTGPNSLHELLHEDVKIEADDEDDDVINLPKYKRYSEFRALAQPVVGEMENPIAGVTRWLRMLMRFPQ